jgi:hypothetical protein
MLKLLTNEGSVLKLVAINGLMLMPTFQVIKFVELKTCQFGITRTKLV